MKIEEMNNGQLIVCFREFINNVSNLLDQQKEVEYRTTLDSFRVFTTTAKKMIDNETNIHRDDIQQRFLAFINKAYEFLNAEKDEIYKKSSTFFTKGRKVLENDLLTRIAEIEHALQAKQDVFELLNIFSILHLQRNEDVHSYFLAWLLDPQESHGLGSAITESFLNRTCKLAGIDYSHIDLSDIKVHSQHGVEGVGVPDLIVEGKNFICVIENKILAGENQRGGGFQTDRYFDYYSESAKEKDQEAIFVYLVPSEEKLPHNENFKQILYSDIVEIIESSLTKVQPSLVIKHLIDMFLFNIKQEVLHEFDAHIQVQNLLIKFRSTDEELWEFWKTLDRYEKLNGLHRKIFKGAYNGI